MGSAFHGQPPSAHRRTADRRTACPQEPAGPPLLEEQCSHSWPVAVGWRGRWLGQRVPGFPELELESPVSDC